MQYWKMMMRMKISRQTNVRDLVLDEMMLCTKYLRCHVQMGCILFHDVCIAIE